MQRRDKDDIDRLIKTMVLYERNTKIQYFVDTGFIEKTTCDAADAVPAR